MSALTVLAIMLALDAPLGFRAAPAEGRGWIVIESSLSGLRRGDRLTAIDGASLEGFYQRNKGYIGAASERDARRRMFDLPFLFPRRFVLTLGSGRQVRVERGDAPPSFHSESGRRRFRGGG